MKSKELWKSEVRDLMQDTIDSIKFAKVAFDGMRPEGSDAMIEVLQEELEKMKTKTPADTKIANAMISQPMGGKTEDEILIVKEVAAYELRRRGYEVVNTLFTDEWAKNEANNGNDVKSPLWFLAKSLEAMSRCNAVYFCKGWEKARGCKIEHDAAVAYGLEIIYEE